MAKEKETKDRYRLVQYPTQTETYIVDNEQNDADGKPVHHELYSALLKIMNDLDEIKRSL